MRKCFYHIMLLFFFFSLSRAQITSDSLLHSPYNFSDKGINSAFEKKLNIYTLRSLINYNFATKGFFLGLKENYSSTIVQSTNKNIRDEHYFSFLGEYEISPVIKAGFTLNNDIYSDNRNLGINQISITHSTLYSRITPVEKINFVPFAGISRNNQMNEMDGGYVYGAELGIDSIRISDFDISSLARFTNEDISPRKNVYRLASVSLSNQFENSLINRLTASYSEQKKDFYFNVDSTTGSYFNIKNNIQSRNEQNYYLQNQLMLIPENSSILFFLFGRIDWRDIDRNTRYINPENISTNSFDTDIKEYRINFISSLSYTYKSLSAQLRISYSEREEKHFAKKIPGANEVFYDRRSELEFQKNNKSQQTTISLSSEFHLSKSNKIHTSILHRKIVYNTPSSLNFDDRDELLTIFRLQYDHQINALLSLFVRVDGSINHLVYILAQRSSNNNIRRVLSLTSGVNYLGKKLRNSTTASVMADYTVYDFREFNPYLKDFSFRRLSISDSLSFNLNRNFQVDIEGYVKLSEQGDFVWSNFTNRPFRYLQEIYAEPMIKFHRENYQIGFGMKYFSLTTYGYEKSKKIIQTEYESVGPSAEIIINTSEKLSLVFQGWYEFINTEAGNNQENINFNLRFNWLF